MKFQNTLKIVISFFIFILFTSIVTAAINIDNAPGLENIKEASIDINTSGTITDSIKDVGFKLLTTVKYIFSGVLLIFIVYVGVQMVLSMGTNEDDLSKAKKGILYALVGLIFINIPGTLYNAFNSNKTDLTGSIGGTWSSDNAKANENLFINPDIFNQTLNGGIISFIEIVIFSLAVFMIILAAYQMIMSKGNSEEVIESKNKIVWSLAGLVFLGFIEAWQKFVFTGEVKAGTDIFETAANLLLFFAGPVTIFFLTLAGYYLITAGGDEEKIKKAKTIIINTLIAIVILLASYIFLADLMTLSV